MILLFYECLSVFVISIFQVSADWSVLFLSLSLTVSILVSQKKIDFVSSLFEFFIYLFAKYLWHIGRLVVFRLACLMQDIVLLKMQLGKIRKN